MPRTLGLVLAGGKATRMGGKKATRLLRGQTLLDHALGKLKPICDALAVSTGARKFALPPRVLALPDLAPWRHKGPLSGIFAGLQAARGYARMLVLACDLPNIATPLLKKLAAALADYECAYCAHGGVAEPLVCALRVDAMLPRVQSALQAGEFKVLPVWNSARCRVFGDNDLANFSPLERTFANVNTLAELSREE